MRRRVAAKMADGDVRAAVRVLTSDEGYISPDCAEAIDAAIDAVRLESPSSS